MNAIINAARAGVSLLGGSIYVYGELMPKGEIMDATPCFICKKMIVNAGIDQVITSTKEGKIRKHKMSDWIKDWRKKDILDDKHQYGDGVNVSVRGKLKVK
jgi:dCMP deaminase